MTIEHNPRLRHLKIKIKALAAEAAIIRHEERKTRKMERWTLSQHRRSVVRRAARHNLLAYAFLRGIAHSQLETHAAASPDWLTVKTIAARFGTATDMQRWADWHVASTTHETAA